jgi:hypothetical protein
MLPSTPDNLRSLTWRHIGITGAPLILVSLHIEVGGAAAKKG